MSAPDLDRVKIAIDALPTPVDLGGDLNVLTPPLVVAPVALLLGAALAPARQPSK